MAKLSFVLPARDESPEVLRATVDGILATSAGHEREIVVVDDASTAPVSLEHPQVRLVRNNVSVGSAQSRRLGVAITTGDVLVVMDAHMKFAPDWIEQMLSHVDCGAVLCAGWWDYEMTHPLCWGAEFLWSSERDYHAGKVPGFGFRHRTRFPGEGAVEVPMIIGACYMMLRRSYEQMGGFSPFFRTWGRMEQDLSIRAWITGVGLKCVTSARVGHLSRSKFPYPVRFSDIEFNQISLVRTIFEAPVGEAIERMLQPQSAQVQEWLAQTDFCAWRNVIQSHRQMSDAEFFQRFMPSAWTHLMQGAS